MLETCEAILLVGSGRIKAGEGPLIGNAGEHYVMAELLKRGIIAALAPRNAPDFDILATKHNHTLRIRVKTKSAEYQEWQWMRKKDGTIFRNLSTDGDFSVLVDLARDTKNMKFYVVPTHKLDTWLKETFDNWANTPGRNNRPHDKTTPKRNLNQETYGKQLEKYLDNWAELGFQ